MGKRIYVSWKGQRKAVERDLIAFVEEDDGKRIALITLKDGQNFPVEQTLAEVDALLDVADGVPAVADPLAKWPKKV